MAQLLSGTAVSAKVLERIAEETRTLPVQPTLAVIIVGDDPASRVYVNNKKKACAKAGFRSLEYALPAEAGQAALLGRIAALNADPSVHGILCQMPLPKSFGYDEQEVAQAISPEKDVDAFHPVNVGHIMLGEPLFQPCTPAGVLELLDDAGISLAGKHVAVVGRSNIVGKPMALLALHRHATVTVCHSRTADLAAVTRQADVLIVAVGRANFITADMIRDGAVVVDVGMNRLDSGKLCGDVDFAAAQAKASWITPVPGGVGPMTIAMLMRNTLTAAKASCGILGMK
ncbi:MAG: bifunctional methylenetetrahydrofolate dehydrogenase/methenyltetrahydrofolate cyclohydrolase FolD [Oscillospiraceae bacterium]|jgi:methylenetetrahydrofolate dehydrogenase (NADP+)/methenyltetrahydrofolate cyclohydrolase|nr:bifunctional methylenetetrahydrofolate dehydrogenase/methenyltetrahydrofolate cyclohydrolase FolD [Oscillospiraceae bacterium]